MCQGETPPARLVRLLGRLDDPLRPSFRPEFATDGERFFFTVGTQESDICVMDLHAR